MKTESVSHLTEHLGWSSW